VGIFRSSDDGQVWTKANTGLPPALPLINELAVDKCGNVVVATSAGAYISVDAGLSWKPMGQLSVYSNRTGFYLKFYLLGTEAGVFLGRAY
jgi:hypothetical protein